MVITVKRSAERKRLGEILVERGYLSERDLMYGLQLQERVGGYIGQILLREGLITERQLLSALSEQLGIPVFDLDFGEEELVPLSGLEGRLLEFMLKEGACPFEVRSREGSELICLTQDPLKGAVRELLHTYFPGKRVRIYLAEEAKIREFAKLYGEVVEQDRILDFDVDESIERLREIASEAPVIKYLNQLFTRAVELRATDIHIEPVGVSYRVRFRIDGILHEIETLEKAFYLALVSRIKLLAGLDIAEKRLPQDGKIATRVASHYLDIRVSTIPTTRGESVVLRLLYKESVSFDIGRLGLEVDHENILLHLISKPYGMILITGPTGSGKTTTLYTLLTRLNNSERKIITVEDPVEYQLEGINQIQVKPEIGLTFAHALRSILRHDPDVVMIGEIRDRETAEIAVHSALTGHLVLSTLHTNDAPSALFRLLEMGIEDYLLNASILGVVAQRIVRKICPICGRNISVDSLSEELREVLRNYQELVGRVELRRGEGCPQCVHTGYWGRIAIFEIFIYDELLKEVFIKTKSLETIRKILKEKYHFRTLKEDGYIKVLKGITTVEEVLRVAQ